MKPCLEDGECGTRLLASSYRVRLLTGDKDDTLPWRLSWRFLAWATRFHNVIAALMAGTPLISLIYTAKNHLLLGKMGLGSCCHHVDSFDVGFLIEQFSRLAENLEEHSGTIRCRVEKFKKPGSP
ncbi:hypothetical protein [Sinorhizobium fredii]|uniref:hypothetical protein n=1 Tax=Rhizobium fredii TaxID=380 RepID=UPI0013E8AF43|nr:hypothetical protein [Sinorhizobium fredii]